MTTYIWYSISRVTLDSELFTQFLELFFFQINCSFIVWPMGHQARVVSGLKPMSP